jgi:hypothetical protein
LSSSKTSHSTPGVDGSGTAVVAPLFKPADVAEVDYNAEEVITIAVVVAVLASKEVFNDALGALLMWITVAVGIGELENGCALDKDDLFALDEDEEDKLGFVGVADEVVDMGAEVAVEVEDGEDETCEVRGGWSSMASKAIDDPSRRGFGSRSLWKWEVADVDVDGDDDHDGAVDTVSACDDRMDEACERNGSGTAISWPD